MRGEPVVGENGVGQVLAHLLVLDHLDSMREQRLLQRVQLADSRFRGLLDLRFAVLLRFITRLRHEFVVLYRLRVREEARGATHEDARSEVGESQLLDWNFLGLRVLSGLSSIHLGFLQFARRALGVPVNFASRLSLLRGLGLGGLFDGSGVGGCLLEGFGGGTGIFLRSRLYFQGFLSCHF